MDFSVTVQPQEELQSVFQTQQTVTQDILAMVLKQELMLVVSNLSLAVLLTTLTMVRIQSVYQALPTVLKISLMMVPTLNVFQALRIVFLDILMTDQTQNVFQTQKTVDQISNSLVMVLSQVKLLPVFN